MKLIQNTGWAAAAIAATLAGSQVPKWLHATDRAPAVVLPTTAPAGPNWKLRNPDANYAIATDICPGLPASALATQAMSNDSDQAKSAIDQLRDQGQPGLDALLAANQLEVTLHRTGAPLNNGNWPKLRATIDAVAGQRDAYASGLYWYTDFAKAQAASQASGKPILSLRLLGNLNDEYSCANSRFFRTVLYANAEVSKELRQKFILHWQSVRPVPVITIDFGDGRKIRRTITGNSIHYILTADGRVIDGIPGLYGPKAFLRVLGAAEKEFTTLRTDGTDATALAQWHSAQEAKVLLDFQADVGRFTPAESITLNTSVKLPMPPSDQNGGSRLLSGAIKASAPSVSCASSFLPTPIATPTAGQAASRANSKSLAELPAISSLPSTTPPPHVDPRDLAQANLHPLKVPQSFEDADWPRIAALHEEDAALDQGSRAMIIAKNPTAAAAAVVARSKAFVETPMIRTIRNFQRSIAEDTVRNEYLYHLQIHRWLADPANTNLVDDVTALNKRVYAQLFLTPDSDPWLGLVPAETYSALDDDGVCREKP